MEKTAIVLTPAFTLAEVLITLGIIGVVAAMTIPTLIANTQKQEYTTSLKKAYTEFNQALTQLSIDNGSPNDISKLTDTQMYKIVNYFKTAKICGTPNNLGCFPVDGTNDKYDGSGSITYYDNTTDGTVYYKFLTTDGMAFAMGVYNGCGNNSTGALGYMTQNCGYVVVDVNGLKGPNYMGRDTFWFWITNGKGATLYPNGGMDDHTFGYNYWWKAPTPNRCTSGDKSGRFCTGRVIEEGWQMLY